MKKTGQILNRMSSAVDLPTEIMPNVPIIEVAGSNRVLIERHCGVSEYGKCKICVKVAYGFVNVFGNNLELLRMSKEQLVITGVIHSISLIKQRG